MKCEACGQEIALAKRCPYCGRTQTKVADEPRQKADEGPRAQFRGRVGSVGDDFSHRPPPINLALIFRYLMDPEIRPWRKWLLYLAIFYVLSPIDILPGALFPGIGWLDDLTVMAITWKWLRGEIARVYPR